MNDRIEPLPGIHPNVPMETYHRGWSALSRSALKILDEGTPGDLQDYLAHGNQATPAMTFGVAAGLLVFEPDEFAKQVLQRPAYGGKSAPAEFRGAGARQRIEAHKAEHADRMTLDPDEWSLVHEVRDAVAKSPAVRRILSSRHLRIEESIVWRDEDTGILLKARPDARRADLGMSIDLKVISDGLSDRSVASYVTSYYAHLQAAMVMRGLKATGEEFRSHTLLMVCRQRPVRVRPVVFTLDEPEEPSWLEAGEAMFMTLVAEYANCVEQGHWPHWGEKGTTLPVPAYIASKMSHYSNRLEKAAGLRAEPTA